MVSILKYLFLFQLK